MISRRKPCSLTLYWGEVAEHLLDVEEDIVQGQDAVERLRVSRQINEDIPRLVVFVVSAPPVAQVQTVLRQGREPAAVSRSAPGGHRRA